jgi:sporulation protein YlmC with PRC-barrel domain
VLAAEAEKMFLSAIIDINGQYLVKVDEISIQLSPHVTQ